jgi:hypothetical protein
MLASALVLAALSGCEGLLDDGDQEQTRQFQAALARWEALNVDDYTFTLALACECAERSALRDVVVTVVNGAVVSRQYDETPVGPAPEAIFGRYDTVEELFDVVAEGISQDADLLNVAYHPTFGVPIVLQLDPDTSVGDDYLIFEVRDFKVTPAS